MILHKWGITMPDFTCHLFFKLRHLLEADSQRVPLQLAQVVKPVSPLTFPMKNFCGH